MQDTCKNSIKNLRLKLDIKPFKFFNKIHESQDCKINGIKGSILLLVNWTQFKIK